MAHLTCTGHSRLELADILVSFRKAGVQNLMALGGDPPADASVGPGELAHALELVELAKAIGGFCIGVAAHPGRHPRSRQPGQRPAFPGPEVAGGRLCRDPVLLRPGRLFSHWWTTWTPVASTFHAARHPASHQPVVGPPHGRDGLRRARSARRAARSRRRSGRPGGRGQRPASTRPPRYARHCLTRARRACTFTRSTDQKRRGASTPTSACQSGACQSGPTRGPLGPT